VVSQKNNKTIEKPNIFHRVLTKKNFDKAISDFLSKKILLHPGKSSYILIFSIRGH